MPNTLANRLPQDLLSQISKLHQDPRRLCHNWALALDRLSDIDRYGREVGVDISQNVGLAAIGLDVSFDPSRGGNRLMSGEVFCGILEKRGYDPRSVIRIRQMIALCDLHAQPEICDLESRIAYDASIAALGGDRRMYGDYVSRLYAEAEKFMTPEAHRAGRLDYLTRLAAKPIYRTDYFRFQYEDRAKENAGREIASLTPKAGETAA